MLTEVVIAPKEYIMTQICGEFNATYAGSSVLITTSIITEFVVLRLLQVRAFVTKL